MKNTIITCLTCEGKISVAQTIQKGEIVTCTDCSTDFEITQTKPITIAKAPEVQEDWGQ